VDHQGKAEDDRRRTEHLEPPEESSATTIRVAHKRDEDQNVRHRQTTYARLNDPTAVIQESPNGPTVESDDRN
jgi:hypothetical protein